MYTGAYTFNNAPAAGTGGGCLYMELDKMQKDFTDYLNTYEKHRKIGTTHQQVREFAALT